MGDLLGEMGGSLGASCRLSGLCGHLRRSGGGDLVRDVAVPLPTAIIGRLLGVPEPDRPSFHRWEKAVVKGTSGDDFNEEKNRDAEDLYA